MLLAKFLPVVVFVSLCYFHFEAYADVIPSPVISKCDPPCQQDSPPVSGYPSYGTQPPPPPSPPPSGYSIYGAPPPPPHHEKGQSKCPPPGGVQCCTPPAPYTYGYGPPNPYAPPNLYTPPNPYTYVPYGEAAASNSVFLPVIVSMIMLSSSFFFHF